jgi:hypothetical protein
MANTLPDGCDRCGGSLDSGYELRTFGPRDSETGVQDEEIVCCACIEKEKDDQDEYNDDRYAAGDERFTNAFEEYP